MTDYSNRPNLCEPYCIRNKKEPSNKLTFVYSAFFYLELFISGKKKRQITLIIIK